MRETRVMSDALLALRDEIAALRRHYEAEISALKERTARPYFCLDDGWGLTFLDSGQPFFVNTRDRNITPWILMGGHWETNVERVMSSYISPGMVVLDIGSHFGYYTIKLGSLLMGSGQLFSFEPNPEVNVFCEENLKINGLSHFATLCKFALGSKTSKETLTFSRSNMASANLIGEQTADYSYDVDVFRLDDVLPPSLSVDLIKLDAEGYERMILEGSGEVLARSPLCAIMLELNLNRWEKTGSLEDLSRLLRFEKKIYAVVANGIQEMRVTDLRDFLTSCLYTENYFFIIPLDERRLARINGLIVGA